MQSSLLKACHLKKSPVSTNGKNTTTLEIKKVLALIIAMGLVSHIDVSE